MAKRERRGKAKTPRLRIFDTLLKSAIAALNISGHFKQAALIDFLTLHQRLLTGYQLHLNLEISLCYV